MKVSLKAKTLAACLVLAVAAVGSYWHFSPYLTLLAMRNAAQSKDAEAFNERVDYPRLRESLKGQMATLMTESMAKSEGGVAALGTMLGADASTHNKLDWTLDRTGANRVVVRAHEAGRTDPGQDFGLVLDRQGFADWKLTEIRLK